MKNLKSRVALLLAVMMLVMGLTGCRKSENATSDGANGGSVYPLEVVDVYGNTVVIEDEPERIVSISPNITELVFTLEVGDKLVGRTDYCDYPAEALDVESVGDYQLQDVEKIISLEPDLVIAVSYFDEANATKLAQADIQVLVLPDVNNLEDVYDMITTMGKILNKESVAETRVNDMKQLVIEVETKVKDLEKPSVYYVVGFGEYGDFTAGGDTFTGSLLNAAGGENIAADISGWSISLETLMERNPDIIIINETLKEEFINAPNYSELTAVKEGRVYTMDVSLLDRPGYRNAQGIETLAKIFYPEAFK